MESCLRFHILCLQLVLINFFFILQDRVNDIWKTCQEKTCSRQKLLIVRNYLNVLTSPFYTFSPQTFHLRQRLGEVMLFSWMVTREDFIQTLVQPF